MILCSLFWCSPILVAESLTTPTDVSRRDPKLRGWDYLAQKLRAAGIAEHEVHSVYRNKRMPPFEKVFFRLNPRESHSMYQDFLREKRVSIARKFLARNEVLLAQAERQFGVSRYIVTAILYIETQFGRVTGRDLVINRLSRLASIGEPQNLLANFEKLSKEDPSVTFEQVRARAQYLEETFFPEVPAVFEIARRNRIDVLTIRGSPAGAFGMPQFLPSNYLKFGLDGNGDTRISLFSEPDAIWSTANFFSAAGWKEDLPVKEKEKVIWMYNKSQAYVDTVLSVADTISRRE